MTGTILRINRKIARKNYFIQVLTFLILSFVTTFPFAPFMYAGDRIFGDDFSTMDANAWISIILLGPLVETLIHQHGIFRIMNAIPQTRKKTVLYIFCSAAIFGLMHWFSFSYVIFAFSAGLIFSYVYYFYHKTPAKAVGTTILIHSLRNLTALAFFYFNS